MRIERKRFRPGVAFLPRPWQPNLAAGAHTAIERSSPLDYVQPSNR